MYKYLIEIYKREVDVTYYNEEEYLKWWSFKTWEEAIKFIEEHKKNISSNANKL